MSSTNELLRPMQALDSGLTAQATRRTPQLARWNKRNTGITQPSEAGTPSPASTTPDSVHLPHLLP